MRDIQPLFLTPNLDDIEVFNGDVNQIAHQHNHNDITVPNLIKAYMPANIQGTFYPVQELDVATVMVKGMLHILCTYVKKPQNSESTYSRAMFSNANLFENAVDRLSKPCPNWLIVKKGTHKHCSPPYRPNATGCKRECREDFMALLVVNVTAPSHGVIKGSSETDFK